METLESLLDRLNKLVAAAEKTLDKRATEITISKAFAGEFAAHGASDWERATKGFTDRERCERIAATLVAEGGVALDGFTYGVMSPVIRVNSELDAPELMVTKSEDWKSVYP